MRDIQQVLERWGAWVADHHEAVWWPSVAAGFAELIPSKIKSRPKCCDEDGMIISDIMARLHRKYPVAHDLLCDYYILEKHSCSLHVSIIALIRISVRSYRMLREWLMVI